MAKINELQTEVTPDVSVLSLSQATTATFTDFYFQYTFVFFIQVASKRVLCPTGSPPGSKAGDTRDDIWPAESRLQGPPHRDKLIVRAWIRWREPQSIYCTTASVL